MSAFACLYTFNIVDFLRHFIHTMFRVRRVPVSLYRVVTVLYASHWITVVVSVVERF
jgi:hypothetical protein